MVYEAARVCKGINLRGREAYATVPNIYILQKYIHNIIHICMELILIAR